MITAPKLVLEKVTPASNMAICGIYVKFLGCNGMLGGGFKHFLCSSLFGEDEPILTIIFFRWVETTNQVMNVKGKLKWLQKLESESKL